MSEPSVAALRPEIRITSLSIRNLNSIRALDLPEDGIGWGGQFPGFVLVGGANGSGKTTLLNLIFMALRCLENDVSLFARLTDGAFPFKAAFIENSALTSLGQNFHSGTAEVRIDLLLSAGALKQEQLRLLLGRVAFVKKHLTESCFGLDKGGIVQKGPVFRDMKRMVETEIAGLSMSIPAVVYLPSRRTLIIPKTQMKLAGKLVPPTHFAYVSERPEEWTDSIEAILYASRWADLNAKENGRPDLATNFSAFAEAFDFFYQGSRRLTWTNDGELEVITDSGGRHGIEHLSEGEQQILLLCAELLRRWRPGSLILIDEPELHLHAHWQSKLIDMLLRFQKERGGQLIIATQSDEFWRLASEASPLILGARS